jgi:hypothetical protein
MFIITVPLKCYPTMLFVDMKYHIPLQWLLVITIFDLRNTDFTILNITRNEEQSEKTLFT